MSGTLRRVLRHRVLIMLLLTASVGFLPSGYQLPPMIVVGVPNTSRAVASADTVQVPPPIGESAADRASILSALRAVRPGGAVQFAAGAYMVGELVPIPTADITLLGHAEGTVLRGCDPARYDELEREAVVATDQAEVWALFSQCGMFELTGGRVTIRDLTFEYSRLGLLLGCCHADDVLRPSPGGYRIERNTFRNSGNSIRAILAAAEPTVVRDNRFINTFHALSAAASRLHMLDNEISMPDPARVPGTGHPGFAIGISPLPPGPPDTIVPGAGVCEQNIVAGNRIEGHTDGILLSARRPGTSCRENEIRDNTIGVRRVAFPVPWIYADLAPLTSPEESTFVGVPLALSASAAPSDPEEGRMAPPRVENNWVEGNRIVGGEGLGIAISHASRNRVANNTMTGIQRRDPFPGNMVGWFSLEWGAANGSGIWVSPGSSGNEITGNTFEDIASWAVVLEGDSNRVGTRRTRDRVRDIGTANRRTASRDTIGSDGEDPEAQEPDPSPHAALTITVAPDVELEVLAWGGSGDDALVFLPGLAMNAHAFDDFAPRFTDDFRVIGITRRGHGNSSRPDSGYALPTLVAEIAAVLDSLGIDRAILAGHPYGGRRSLESPSARPNASRV